MRVLLLIISVGVLWNAWDIRKMQQEEKQQLDFKKENDLLIKTINDLNNRITFLEEGIPEIVRRNTKAKYIKNIVLENIKETRENNFKSESELNQYALAVVEYSEKFKVPASLILAVSRAESNFNPRAVSPTSAKGVMQLIDTTMSACAFKLNKSSYDVFWVKDNVEAGTYYLSYLKGIFETHSEAIKAYNGRSTTC